ncbi:MAG TPA: metallophosphoesterase [Allosphingosinicella sp.]|nr:metallophosphoesterase [Allosphingosinicella sp.]
MIRRSTFRLIASIASLLAAFLPSTPSRSQPGQRIVAVGDLHGDFEAYRGIIRAAALVDRRDRWAGGRTVFVQTGDIADRGPDSRKIIRHLMRLQREAARAGGEVIVLVGNHEAMNVIGDLRYVDPGEYRAFVDRHSRERRALAYQSNEARIRAHLLARDPDLTAQEIREEWMRETPLGAFEHRAAWHPDGEIGRWVSRNPAVALIQGNLFVHAGISRTYAGLSILEINRRVRDALIARETGPDSIINDPAGPLWYRGHVLESEGPATPDAKLDELRQVLQAHRAQRLIIGHTPRESRIQILHGGQLVLIDTGISDFYGSRWAYLEILNGRVIPHSVASAPSPHPEERSSR